MESLDTLLSLVARLHKPGNAPCVMAIRRDDIQQWSYAEVADYAGRLANGLRGAGLTSGEQVVLLASSRPEWIVAALAVLAAGGVVVPLDTQIPTESLRHVLSDSGARFVVTTTDYLGRLNRLGLEQPPQALLLDVAAEDKRSWRALLAAKPAAAPTVMPDDPAVMFYTSGTTGTPKGVPLTHRNLVFQIEAVAKTGIVGEQDRVLLPLPLYHVYPFTIGLLVPLAFGAPIIMPEAISGPQIMRAIQQGRPTIMVGVPRLYRALFDGIAGQFRSRGKVAATMFDTGLNLSRWLRRRLGVRVGKVLLRPLHARVGTQLRLFASGGSALDPELAKNLEALGWQVAIGYGLTETAPILTMNLPGSPSLESVGKPIPGVELRIAGESDGATPGEVLARGPNVFAGYRNLPDQTEKAFTPDGWFRTGDLGSLDTNGYLFLAGRASTMIVTEGGKNVQPEPVEEVYAQSPVIKEVGILEHEGKLVALVVPEVEEASQRFNGDVPRAVREAVAAQSALLPSYQRVSDFAMSLEPLPKTNLGKIRRHTLAELFAQAKRGESRNDTAPVGPLPLEDMSESDRALLEQPAAREVWDWLAQRYPDRQLTPDTSPTLDLGLDSLGWMSMALELGERTGVELSEEAIRRITNVRDLLREMGAAAPTQRHTPVLDRPEEVLSAEQRSWLEPQGSAMRSAGVVLYAVNRLVSKQLFNLEVQGLENLPSGQFVLTPNHRSYLDAFVVGAALPYQIMRRTYWAGSAEVVFTTAPGRLLARLAQIFPVGGEGALTGSSPLAFAALILQRGHNLTWFPEGRLARSKDLLPFRHGLGLVLQRYPTPVVPVWLEGTDIALPVGSIRPRRHTVRVVFGPACDPRELAQSGKGNSEAERIMQALHERVAALREQAVVVTNEQ